MCHAGKTPPFDQQCDRTHWAQLLMHAQPSGTQSQSKWGPVRQALVEILFPVELNAQRVADRINSGDRPPIRTLLRRLAESGSSPDAGTDPSVLAKHMRQARSKVERTGKRAGNLPITHIFRMRD